MEFSKNKISKKLFIRNQKSPKTIELWILIEMKIGKHSVA